MFDLIITVRQKIPSFTPSSTSRPTAKCLRNGAGSPQDFNFASQQRSFSSFFTKLLVNNSRDISMIKASMLSI